MAQYGYVLSLNSRGVPTFTWNGIGSCGDGIGRGWKNFCDIGLSWVVFLRLLNSNSWLSMCLVFFSTLFYYRVLRNVKYLDNVWTIYCFLIVLPILILVILVYNRREAALKHGAKVKVLVMALFHLHRDFLSAGDKSDVRVHQMKTLLHSLLDHMQAYFNHSRPTATHFYWPYGPSEPLPGTVMGNEAVSIHLLNGAVMSDFKKLTYASQALRAAGAGEPVLLRHGQLVADLHLAFQRMALIKEMRTPLVLRSCCLFYSTVILPLLLGPFWSLMGRNMGFVFAVFVALLTHSVILGLLNLTVMYEDPYDDKVMSQSVDNVSVVELADTCKWLLEDDEDEESLLAGSGHLYSEHAQPPSHTQPPAPPILPVTRSITIDQPGLQPAPTQNPLFSNGPSQSLTANGAHATLSKLQFTSNIAGKAMKKTGRMLRSPASAVSPPMPPIIGSAQLPETARSEYDA